MNEMILVVDDDPAVRTILECILLSAGYRACTATGGAMGIRKALEEKPSLILLDINMPGTDGCDVAQTLKNEPKTAGIPIVFISGLVTPREETILGPWGYPLIAKPFNRAKILETVQKYICAFQTHAPA